MRKLAVLAVLAVLCFVSCATTQQLILEGKDDDAKAMFQSLADIDSRDARGYTVLHAAAQVNNVDMITFLLIKGANSSLKDRSGDTALHVAIKYNSIDAARILAERTNDIFIRNDEGMSALELGLSKGEAFYPVLLTRATGEMREPGTGKSVVHYLTELTNREALLYAIAQGLPLSAVDAEGKTPLEIAYEKNTIAGINLAVPLIEANADPVGGDYAYFETAVRLRNPGMKNASGQTPLHIAVIQGQTGITEYLLSENVPLMAQDITGATPLHEAVSYGQTHIAEILLAAGADANARDNMGKPPLLLIIPQDVQSEMYRLLIANRGNVNIKDMYGDSPLHVATLSGSSVDTIRILTDAGADVNERNKQGITPLAIAVDKQRTDLAEFYTQIGGDIHAEDMQGRTPLTRALKSDLKMLSMLVNEHTIGSRDSYGNTPLHIAVITEVPEVATDGSSDADRKVTLAVQNIKYMIDLNADINARNRSGDTPLSLAVQQNKQQAGETLLAAGADIYSTNTDNYSPLRLALVAGGQRQSWMLNSDVVASSDGSGNTPLHYAAEWKLTGAITTLVDRGAAINAQNANGETPLFTAVRVNSPDCVNLLIKNDAQKDARDYLGNTPLHMSIRWNSYDAARALLASGVEVDAQNKAGKTPLSEAAKAGKTQLVTLFLNSGANVNTTDATGQTVLIESIQSGSTDTVRLLLSRGASVQMQEMNGRNAYHFAAETGNVEIINMVRQAGGNPMSRDKNGQTPFTLVLNQGEQVMRAVLGTSRDITDSDGNTPIHVAVSHRVPASTLRFLISLGYPMDSRNGAGLTPLTEATAAGELSLAQVLLENGADPYIADNRGESAASAALRSGDINLLSYIVKYAGSRRDVAGEGLLHYAARIASPDTAGRLLSMGLDKTSRNIAGETAYDVAVRWKRANIASLLK